MTLRRCRKARRYGRTWLRRMTVVTLVHGLMANIAACVSTAPLGTDVESACVDLWSIAHAGSGYLLAGELGGGSLPATVGVLAAYELVEPHFWPGFSESTLNQACDVAVGTLAAARR